MILFLSISHRSRHITYGFQQVTIPLKCKPAYASGTGICVHLDWFREINDEKVASTQIPCVAENSREEVRSAADSAVCGRKDATVRGARVPHGSGEAPAQNAVCVVSVSSYVRGAGSVPWIDDSRAFAVVRVAGGRPGVAKDCRRPEAMARCCWVPIKEAFVIKWPVCEVWDETGIY